MIKLIIFDLDGVLIDSRKMHYITLNKALEEIDERFVISHDEHLLKYDGRSTTYKLNLLTQEKGLPVDLHTYIWKRKQDFTQEVILNEYVRDDRICDVLKKLSEKYTIYCASNAIRETITNALTCKGFIEYIEYYISNEEVAKPKPSPEIYQKCFSQCNVFPHEVLICEDSPIGRQAAIDSGAVLCPIENPWDVTIEKISAYL